MGERVDSRQIVEEASGPIKIDSDEPPLIVEEEGSVSSYEYEDEEEDVDEQTI